jgi:hypothetical protein
MATLYEYRVTLIVPVAKVPQVVNWFNANIGADALPPGLGPALSSSGNPPATHNWCCGAAITVNAQAILNELCTLAGVAPPDWDNMTRAERIAWVVSARTQLLSKSGIYTTLADNEGQWDDPETALSMMGLKRIEAP